MSRRLRTSDDDGPYLRVVNQQVERIAPPRQVLDTAQYQRAAMRRAQARSSSGASQSVRRIP
jgi:hypothetical protein